MSKITVALAFHSQPWLERTLPSLVQSPLIGSVIVVHRGGFKPSLPKCEGLRAASFISGKTLTRLLEKVKTPYLLIVRQAQEIQPGPYALERFVEVAKTTKAGMVYADHYEQGAGGRDAARFEECANPGDHHCRHAGVFHDWGRCYYRADIQSSRTGPSSD